MPQIVVCITSYLDRTKQELAIEVDRLLFCIHLRDAVLPLTNQHNDNNLARLPPLN